MTLRDFLATDYWQILDAENRSPGSARMILDDPARFDRIWAAAEQGGEGSTHGEVIEDWRQALDCAARDGVVTEWDRVAIAREIDAAEDWHERHGTLDDVIG